MPELPEVETVKNELSPHIVGRRITGINLVWEGIVNTFPDEPDWAAAKGDYAQFISSQAELLRARVESERTSEGD